MEVLTQLWITTNTERELRGIPIGNLTSQIFANIYLDKFDQFVKHILRARHYFRYADDFVIVHSDRDYLAKLTIEIGNFLRSELALELHPDKVEIRKFTQGIDFLGYVILPYHIVPRTKTRRRMFRKLFEKQRLFYSDELGRDRYNQSLQSYLGLADNCDGYNLHHVLKNNFFVPREKSK